MFKKKKRSEEAVGSGAPRLAHQHSSGAGIGEGVEFDKFDPEVNKGVFRKRDANELLAALSSGDLEEEVKKGKKKRTRTSPRAVESTPRDHMSRSATASVLEAVQVKGEEKEDRFLVEMDRLLDEYEGLVHSRVDRELTKGRSAQDVSAGVMNSRSLRMEKKVSEADVDASLRDLLGEEERDPPLEEFDDAIALDVLSLRKEFEVLTEEEEEAWKNREGSVAPRAVQGEQEATAELLAAVAQYDSVVHERDAQDNTVGPAPVSSQESVGLMDSQALKDAILADIGDGKGTSSSKIKLQRNSATDAFRNTGAKDLKKDLLSQLAGGETSFAAVTLSDEPETDAESEEDRREAEAEALAALAASAVPELDDAPPLPSRGTEGAREELEEGTRGVEDVGERKEEKEDSVGEEEYATVEESDSNDVREAEQEMDEELSGLIATLDGAMAEEVEEEVQLPVLAENHDDLERSRAQSVAQSTAATSVVAVTAGVVAAAPARAVADKEGGEEQKAADEKVSKKKKKKKASKKKGEGESNSEKKERRAKRREKKERGEGSIIGDEREGKERRHRSKEERKLRREERRERKASLASEAGSETASEREHSHVSRGKSHVSRAKKSERKKHSRKGSDASIAGGEQHSHSSKHRHKKKGSGVQKGKKEEKEEERDSNSERDREDYRTKVERTPTLPSTAKKEVTAVAASAGVVHSLPPPLKENGEGEEEVKKEMTEEEAARAQKKNFRKSVYTLGPISDAGIGLDEFDFPDPEHIVPDRTVAREDSRGTRFEKDGKWYFRPLANLPPPREFWGREKKYVRLDMHTIFRYDVNAHIEEFNAASD